MKVKLLYKNEEQAKAENVKADNISEIETNIFCNPLMEMATFGVECWGNNVYKIAVHGAATKDREVPHIHIYLNKDVNHKNFNFEISFIDLLCKDEINLVYQLDRKNNIKRTHRSECSWVGYSDILEGFKKFLFKESKASKHVSFLDNLDRAIYEWNRETDFHKTEEGGNPLKDYIEAKGLTVLPKFKKYFENN